MCCSAGAHCLARSGECEKSPCNLAVCTGLVGVFCVCCAAYNLCLAKQAWVAAHSPGALHLLNVVNGSPSRRDRVAYRNRIRAESIDLLQDQLLEGSMAYAVAIPSTDYGTCTNHDDDDVPVAKYATLDEAIAVPDDQRGPVLVEPPTAVVPSGGRA